jgi:6-pyruvoyltetrahydropterin/6-carboxytetrahydropterin synthase
MLMLFNPCNFMKIRITKRFTFEMAHALEGYDGPCKDIHGHSYTLEVTVSGEPIIDRSSPKLGMVIDFGDLKRIVNERIVNVFDHALVLKRGFESMLFSSEGIHRTKLILTDFQPTSEHFIGHFAALLIEELPQGVVLEKLKLHETATSFVEWLRADQ